MDLELAKSLFIKLIIFLILLLGGNRLQAQEEFDFNIFLETLPPVHEDSLAHVLFQKGNEFFLNDSFAVSKVLLIKSIDYSRDLPDRSLEGRTNLVLGKVNNELLEFNKSLEAFQSALNISSEIKDTSLMLNAMHGIHNYYYQMEEMDSAVAYCTKSIALAKAIEDYADLSGSYSALSSYLAPSNSGVLKNSFLIEGLMDSCLIAAGKAGDPKVLVYALSNYGLDYFNKSPEIGIQYLQAAVDSARNLPSVSNALVYALTKSSEAYFRSDQLKYSKSLMDEALLLADSIDDHQQLIHLHYLHGRYYDRKDSIELALESYNEAIYLAEKFRHTYYLSFIYNKLFQYYYSRNLMDSSYVYQQKYMDVSKKEHDKEMSLQIARLSAKFQVDQKIETIDNLTLIGTQKQIIIRNQKRYIISLFFGILVGVVLFLFLLLQLRQIRSDHRKLAQNAKEINEKNKLIADLKLKRENKLEHVHDDLKIRLIELIVRDEIFLKKDLTLSKTALLLKTNTSYLSGLINKEFSCKFNQFINKYRVAKACELLANSDMDVYSIEGIADLSGFKSKSVFNLEFKEVTGVQPSVYRKSIPKSSKI